MEECDAGEYGHPYPRVDMYGNPVPPVDQNGNPMPREPATAGLGNTTGHVTAEHEGVRSGGVTAPGGVAAAYPSGGGVGTGETATVAGMGAAQLQPTREEAQTTLGEKLRRSGSSSSSSSSEDDGQGGRRKKKSIKDKIKEKLPGGGHKQREEQKQHAMPATAIGTHAAGTHEKKSIMDKIKGKLPGHH